jgi:hypothetical protein
MKNIYVLITLLILFATFSCFSQKLVQKETEFQKIIENKEQFIGKPLKEFLKEVQPPLKRVIATPSKNIQSYVGNFRFNFMADEEVKNARSKGKTPITIVVFVKEYFEWDFQKRPKGKETVWTAEDAKKYENLTIVGFRVYGNTAAIN